MTIFSICFSYLLTSGLGGFSVADNLEYVASWNSAMLQTLVSFSAMLYIFDVLLTACRDAGSQVVRTSCAGEEEGSLSTAWETFFEALRLYGIYRNVIGP